MNDYLFAYGTLAEDNAPAEIAGTVKELKCIGDGFILGRLYDAGEYPAAVLSSRLAEKVFGKIFEIPADGTVLERLDAYEGFEPDRPRQSLFVRKRTAILRSNDKKLTGWVYEYNGNVKSLQQIKDGRYSNASRADANISESTACRPETARRKRVRQLPC